MGWTKKQILLALMMVVTGSINTLSTKWADEIDAENSAGEVTKFVHPYFQTEGMFIGEILCMLAFYIMRCMERRKRREQVEMSPSTTQSTKFPKYIFLLPALCDTLATSTMYLGLTLTYASSFQMLRGAVIVFTGLLSVAFLGRKIKWFQWLGILIIIVGLVIVGVSDILVPTGEGDYTTNKIITGDLLIIAAQVITASQMVLEEKFVLGHDVPPLLAVGWEGVFGFTIMTILIIPFNFIDGGVFAQNPSGTLEDIPDAFYQIGTTPLLLVPILGNIFSIAFFNFAGVSVTKELSATTRMVLDSVRTLVVWIFSLIITWQEFQYLQPVGFVVLILGMMLYNDIIILPFCRSRGWISQTETPDDTEPVIAASSSSASSARIVEADKRGIDNQGSTVEVM
ncbi:solute carrier family 35 member F6-like isoform X2 [Portunus trituberculatus]|uniref:solute carrier family 35 member F6-like isoform X2 n=1 Tax=Portunus trituberculatus TaxID=210409 RepID=UPI001E1CD878|nr:solute carrier family 35 member F6-like isoform X2 [Portunus trituberculatus]